MLGSYCGCIYLKTTKKTLFLLLLSGTSPCRHCSLVLFAEVLRFLWPKNQIIQLRFTLATHNYGDTVFFSDLGELTLNLQMLYCTYMAKMTGYMLTVQFETSLSGIIQRATG